MNSVTQFIVELSWALTMGVLLSAGALAAKAIGLICAVAGCGTLAWRRWKRRE